MDVMTYGKQPNNKWQTRMRLAGDPEKDEEADEGRIEADFHSPPSSF